MNIAVFGWYHHQNAGDDRIQQCITRWLDGHTLAFLPAGRPPPVHMLRTYDAVIIGGGGIIMKRGGVFKNMTRWVRSAGIPAALVSVSIEQISPALREELRNFMGVCCFAWFRDHGSMAEVGEHPNAFVAPDITWLYPYDVVEPKPQGIAVCLRKQRGRPLDDWRHVLSDLGQPLHPWPFYFEKGGDAGVLAEMFPTLNVPQEFTVQSPQQSSAVISGRFHGLIFALQMGLPVITISSRPKVKRFSAEHGLERWRVSEDCPQALMELWPEFKASHNQLREQALQLRDKQCAQVENGAAKAKEKLLAAAAALPPPSRRFNNRIRSLLDIGSYF
jgi:polysaccharide pyruvyl transferase WcaK-like protein